jgi:hypothetical protein
LGTSAEVGVLGFLAIEAVDEILADDGLLVERSGHHVLEDVEVDVAWADHSPFGSRQALLSSVGSGSCVSFANGGLHLEVGECVSACDESTATNILQAVVPLEGEPGFEGDGVILTGVRVLHSDVAVVDILNLEGAVVEVVISRNTGGEVQNGCGDDVENLSAIDNGSRNVRRCAGRGTIVRHGHDR